MLIKFLNGTEREIVDLRGADLRGADLRGADLRGADLRHADLRGAILRGADLRGASLRGADLRGASLRGADLREADLREADLREAALCDADLRDAILHGADLHRASIASTLLSADIRIARLDFGGWPVCVMPTRTTIGCQSHPNAMWLKADPRWIAAMNRDAAQWWARHGATVQAAIRDVMAP